MSKPIRVLAAVVAAALAGPTVVSAADPQEAERRYLGNVERLDSDLLKLTVPAGLGAREAQLPHLSSLEAS